MTRDEIDVMWQRALHESVKDGEQFTRYHFAGLVLEAAAVECDAAADRSMASAVKVKTVKASDIYGAAASHAVWLAETIRAMKPG